VASRWQRVGDLIVSGFEPHISRIKSRHLKNKQGYKLCRLFCKSLGKKFEKHGLALFLNLFGKENAVLYITFYAHVHACSPSYTDEE